MHKYIIILTLAVISSCSHQYMQQSANSINSGDYEVFFDVGSDALDASSQQTLRAVAHVVTRSQPKKILINGNADRSGTLQHNKELSLKRAESVANFLENRGVSRDIMDIRAYGSSAAWNDKKEGDADVSYRTVKIVLLKYNKIEYR